MSKLGSKLIQTLLMDFLSIVEIANEFKEQPKSSIYRNKLYLKVSLEREKFHFAKSFYESFVSSNIA